MNRPHDAAFGALGAGSQLTAQARRAVHIGHRRGYTTRPTPGSRVTTYPTAKQGPGGPEPFDLAFWWVLTGEYNDSEPLTWLRFG